MRNRLNNYSFLFIILFLNGIFPSVGQSQVSKLSETEITMYIQSLIGGKREVSVTSGRIDLLIDTVAYEVERAKNWKEAIGQSLWYALQSNTRPGIILILEKKTDYNYFLQLNSALKYAGLDNKIQVLIFPHDFEKYIKDE